MSALRTALAADRLTELFERLEQDLVVLREHDFEMPRPAQAYCGEWVDRGQLAHRGAG